MADSVHSNSLLFNDSKMGEFLYFHKKLKFSKEISIYRTER